MAATASCRGGHDAATSREVSGGIRAFIACGGKGAGDTASRASFRLRASRAIHALGEDVPASVSAPVLPRDDRAPGAVGYETWRGLVLVGRADRHSFGRPLRGAQGAHALRVDIARSPAAILPGDDRTAAAVGDERRSTRPAGRRTQPDARGTPQQSAARLHALRVDLGPVSSRWFSQVTITPPESSEATAGAT